MIIYYFCLSYYSLTDHSSPVQMALLLHEGLALVGMVNKHVYTVIGVAAEERVPPFLIYPDDGFRNLKRQVHFLLTFVGYFYNIIFGAAGNNHNDMMQCVFINTKALQ